MGATMTSENPIHYIMWEMGFGGLELSVINYIAHFAGRRPLNAYSLRPVWDRIYDESKIAVQEGPKESGPCYRKYFRYCRRRRDGIFHLLNVGPVVLLLTLLAGVKNPVYHIHGTKHWRSVFQKCYLKIMWWFCSLFRFSIVANSAHSASIFREEIMPRKSAIIHNGFEIDAFLEKKRKRTALQKIGYAGRLNNGKNVDLVIRLFEEIAGQHPGLELLIAGDGPLRAALEKQVAQSPFANRIICLGNVKDMPSFYEALDMMLFLSAHESFGNVLVEALLTGLPVLTSTVPAFDEIHGGEADFVLGDPADYKVIRSNFLKALDDFTALAEKAYEMSTSVKEKFDVKHHLNKMEKIYEIQH
jgi:glycosyltransferase involved in cell wall biosynthesis